MYVSGKGCSVFLPSRNLRRVPRRDKEGGWVSVRAAGEHLMGKTPERRGHPNLPRAARAFHFAVMGLSFLLSTCGVEQVARKPLIRSENQVGRLTSSGNSLNRTYFS